MKIDTQEMKNVAAIEAPRMDLYVTIHKAIRAFMADTLLAVGRMDSGDDLELAQVTERVLGLLDFMLHHVNKENTFVHPAIEARASGASAAIANDHVDHEKHIAHLASAVASLRACAAGQRAASALFLYRELSGFVAENLEHMLVEETAHNAVLWARYTDAELMDIHHRLVGSIQPAEMMVAMRWMVPFMNPAERAMVLGDMRAHAPAPAFDAVLATVRPHLTEREWEKLEQSLSLRA
jgi:hypothetical protein